MKFSPLSFFNNQEYFELLLIALILFATFIFLFAAPEIYLDAVLLKGSFQEFKSRYLTLTNGLMFPLIELNNNIMESNVFSNVDKNNCKL